VVTAPRQADRYARLVRALGEVTAEVTRGRDRTEVLERVCAHARTLAAAASAVAMLADHDGVLVVRAVAGPVATWLPGVRVPAGDTVAGTLLRDGSPLPATPMLSVGLLRSPRRHERALAAAGLRRAIYLPIPAYGSVAGVLGVAYRHGAAPTARDLRTLEPLAAVAGLVPAHSPPDEREWLARELHDSVVQTLYGISLGAGAAGELLRNDTTQAQESVAWIHETAVAGLTEMHGLIQRLRPDALEGTGLSAALGRLLETLHTLHGCRTTAELGPEPPVSPEARQALYRIAQEAIANAAKHARAGQVTLRLHTDDPTVVLEVIDDGQGFAPGGDFRGRLGIRSMRERAEGAGGRLDLISGPGRGTVVRVEVPTGA
jgi:signal transduction histidine kinase